MADQGGPKQEVLVDSGVSGPSGGKLLRVESQRSPRTCNILLENSSDVGTRGIHREGNLG